MSVAFTARVNLNHRYFSAHWIVGLDVLNRQMNLCFTFFASCITCVSYFECFFSDPTNYLVCSLFLDLAYHLQEKFETRISMIIIFKGFQVLSRFIDFCTLLIFLSSWLLISNKNYAICSLEMLCPIYIHRRLSFILIISKTFTHFRCFSLYAGTLCTPWGVNFFLRNIPEAVTVAELCSTLFVSNYSLAIQIITACLVWFHILHTSMSNFYLVLKTGTGGT